MRNVFSLLLPIRRITAGACHTVLAACNGDLWMGRRLQVALWWEERLRFFYERSLKESEELLYFIESLGRAKGASA